MLNLLLAECGAEVKVSSSVQDAIEVMAGWRPDVVVSDIGMPNEDGFALIARLKALGAGEGKAIPALALTGYARPEDRKRLMMAGYQLHMAKPVGLAELSKAIVRLAGRELKERGSSAE
jgi:CheY-like chemotaxis protein